MAKRARQKSLPTMEPKKNSRLSELLISYVEKNDERAKATREAAGLKDTLIYEMGQANLLEYRDPETQLGITIEPKSKVKIHRGGEDDKGPKGVAEVSEAPDAEDEP